MFHAVTSFGMLTSESLVLLSVEAHAMLLPQAIALVQSGYLGCATPRTSSPLVLGDGLMNVSERVTGYAEGAAASTGAESNAAMGTWPVIMRVFSQRILVAVEKRKVARAATPRSMTLAR